MKIDDTIISQYAKSSRLVGLIERFAAAFNDEVIINAFFANVWDITQAKGWGLDIWGQIVGVQRVLKVPQSQYFGFTQAFDALSWGYGSFYSGSGGTQNFRLNDASYLTLILAKAAANICNGSSTAINQILLSLFPGRGNCYVADNMNMSITYTFSFHLSPVEQAIIEQSGALPRPACITVNYSIPA